MSTSFESKFFEKRKFEQRTVQKYFDGVKFVDGEKDPEYYKSHIDTSNPSRTIVIGDRARSELAAGKSLNATTIWVRQGRYADELPESEQFAPDHQVQSLIRLRNLLLHRLKK